MGRYRLPDGPVIPEFGSGKNPFTTKTLPPQEEPSSAAGVTTRAALTQAAPPSSVPLPRPSQARAAQMLARAVQGLRGSASRLKRWSVRGLLWGKRCSTMLIARIPRRTNRMPFASSTAPQPKGPVQGELSLENLRVVRNDLTDTDYEVVSMETSTASPVKRVPQTVAVPAEPRPLGRLAERLFSHKTQ